MTTWVEMYHPALPGSPHVRVPSRAEALYAAHGWLDVNGSTPVPVDIYLTPGVGDLRYTKLADVANPATTTGAALRAAYGLSVVATVSASTTLAVGKFTPVDATATARTMTLPTGAGDGVTIGVEKVDASVNAVSVTGNIRGVPTTTVTLPWQHETLLLRADASGSWWPVAGHKTKAALDAVYGPNVLGSANNPVTSASAARPTGLTKVFWQTPTLPTNWITGDEWINNS